jgi:hypothetical protein
VKDRTPSKFEIELLLADGPYMIGVDAESALNVMDEAMRQYPSGHIRIANRRTRATRRVKRSRRRNHRFFGQLSETCAPVHTGEAAQSFGQGPTQIG